MPLLWQADLLSLSRASLYYKPRLAGEQELTVKHRLDELYTAHPFLGSRKIVELLAGEGITRKRVPGGAAHDPALSARDGAGNALS